MASLSQTQIDALQNGASAALNALNAAYRAQTLAENVPVAGAALDHVAAEATDIVTNLRLALISGLATLTGAVAYSSTEIESAINAAIHDRGIEGISVSANAGPNGATLTLTGNDSGSGAVAIEPDLGLQGLALSVTGTVAIAAQAAFNLSLGLDTSGFYLQTGAGQGLTLSVDGSGLALNPGGAFGVLSYSISDQGTTFGYDFDVQLTDGDGKLRLSELSSDFLSVTMSGAADVRLGLEADFGTGALPSVSAQLNVDWDFASAVVDPGDHNETFGNRPTVQVGDVSLDLGSFMQDVMLPIFDAIAPVLQPIRIALDVVTSDISMLKLLPDWETLLDKTGDGKINLLDLLRLADDTLDLKPIEDFIQLASDILSWADFLSSANLTAANLVFGDFALGPDQDIRSLLFDLGNATGNFGTLAETLTDAIGTLSGGAWDGSGGGRDILEQMASGTSFSLPILQDPAQVIKLLFGGNADLIEIDFPKVELAAGSETLIQIPIFPGINVAIGGIVSAAFDLAFGYDTRGLSQPGASVATALNGLYIIDGEASEVALQAAINLGINLDALIASIYGGGDITGTVLLDLADNLQTVHGRLYYDQFVAAVTSNPFSLFDVSGSITAGLSLAVRVLGADILRLDSPRLTLADFNFDERATIPLAEPLGLADQSDAVLTLNIGALAGLRMVGEATDGPEIVNVTTGLGSNIVVSIDGYAMGFGGVGLIVGDAGEGNDQIALAPSLAIAGDLSGGAGNDLLVGGAEGDTLSGDDGADTLLGQDGNDVLNGGAGNDLLFGGAGADTIDGGAGDDMLSYAYSSAGVSVDLGTGAGLGGEAEGDQLNGIEVLQGSHHADTLTGGAADEMIVGLEGDDRLNGGEGADVLLGSEGADTLDGGSGADTLVGAAGNDVYLVDNVGDVVNENLYGEILPGDDPGIDEVRAAIDWSLSTPTQGDIENLTLIGIAVVGTGNALSNTITANQAALPGGRLNGGGGADTLIGSSAAEVLDGGIGADSMIGGAGNDTYLIDTQSDIIVEKAGDGIDTAVVTLASYVLAAEADIEILALDHSISSGTLEGNAVSQLVIGADGHDTLIGNGGADALNGGEGTDRASYRTSATGVVIDLGLLVQVGGDAEGDTFVSIEEIEGSTHADVLTGAGANDVLIGLADNDTLQGLDGDDTLYGGSGDDVLAGGTGADHMLGGDGNDVYRVDDAGDIVTEIGTGADTVEASVDWSLNTGGQQSVEVLVLTGDAQVGTGNALDNLIIGTAGNDTLTGLAGADTIQGGAGDDLFVLDSAADVALDQSGHDRIRLSAAASFDMATHASAVEDLTIIGSSRAVLITGNELDNMLTGGDRDDTLYGGAGNDTLIAGAGGQEHLYGGVDDDELRMSLASLGTHVADGGAGYDRLILDWQAAEGTVSLISNSSGTYYRTVVPAFGEVQQYFSDIEEIDLTTGSGADQVYAVGGRDRFITGEGTDRIYGIDRGDTVDAGGGMDWASVDLRFGAGEVDPAEDIHLVLADQAAGMVCYAGTTSETAVAGLERAWLYTGAGNDVFDARGVASSWNLYGVSNHFSSGAGDDTYATDLLALGYASFEAGAGYDRLIVDWQAAEGTVSLISNSSGTYYRTVVPAFGEVQQYFSDIEEIDLTTGSGADQVYAVGGRDRFITGEGTDRIYGIDRGDTVDAGGGMDWASVDLRFGAGEVDPAEDIRLVLADQAAGMVYYAGTTSETAVAGLERAWLYTGAGNDVFDARGVASSWNLYGVSNHFSSGAGDDTYATDLLALGYASFEAGAGYDRLILDWQAAEGTVSLISNSSGTYYRTVVPAFGEVQQYFSDIEEIDLTTGSGADQVYAVGGRDRFITGEGTDRIYGIDRGDTVDAGGGMDWASVDLRFGAGEVDPAEDIRLVLADQAAGMVYYAGTTSETAVAGLERAWLYTGAGNDVFDARGVASSWNLYGVSNHFSSGAGDDTYATDLLALGYASFEAGAGYDRLILDWQAAEGTVSLISNSSGTYYRTVVPAFGEVQQYFSDIEEIDLTTGSGADQVYAVGGRDRFITGEGTDRIYGIDRGDTVDAGGGMDWASVDLRFGAGEVDPAEDIRLVLADQAAGMVYYAGTTSETAVAGLERAWLYTGAGNDVFDARGVASSWNLYGVSNHFSSGAGDDTYATDLLALGYASFEAGAGYDRLILDWQAAEGTVSLISNSSGTYYRTVVPAFGEVQQYFSDVEAFTLTGGSASDRLLGGAYRDVLMGGAGGDTLLAGDGRDLVKYTTSNAGVQVSLLVDTNGFQSATGGDATGDVIAGFEDIAGSRFADSLTGDDGDNFIRGLNGKDTLIGGSGKDRLDGGAGADAMAGGSGADTYYVDNLGDTVTEVSDTGIDLVYATVSFTLGAYIENLTLTGAGSIAATGNELSNKIKGNTGDNQLSGLGGDDHLYGGSGNDLLDGGLGNDRLLGGEGDDIYVVDAVGDRVFETTATASLIDAGGIDTVQSGVSFNLDAYAGVRFVERLTLTGTGNINGTGNALANILTGNAGNNVLKGGSGDDTLLGGEGNDTLVGGTGADTFIFVGAFGNDTVSGFDRLQVGEVIVISAIVDFADLVSNHLTQGATGAVITSGLNTITLTGVLATDLLPDDFLF